MLTITCAIADTTSAIKVGAETGKVTFEIPTAELHKLPDLISLMRKPLRVTLEETEGYE